MAGNRAAASEPLTETCKNQRLRNARREVWRDASTMTSYWRARLDWHSALGFAQGRGIADADRFSPGRQRKPDVARRYMACGARETAAHASAGYWGSCLEAAQLRAENYRYSDVKPERIERAIADDVAFLEAHPTRRSIAASRQSSKPEPA